VTIWQRDPSMPTGKAGASGRLPRGSSDLDPSARKTFENDRARRVFWYNVDSNKIILNMPWTAMNTCERVCILSCRSELAREQGLIREQARSYKERRDSSRIRLT